MDLTDCKTGTWHDVIRIDTMSIKMKMRMAHLGLIDKVMVVSRHKKGPVKVMVSKYPKSPPLILGHGLARKVIIKEPDTHNGDRVGKNMRGW
jgi:hypothetical protein